MPKRQRRNRAPAGVAGAGQFIMQTMAGAGTRLYNAAANAARRRLNMAAEGAGEGMVNAVAEGIAAGGARVQNAVMGAAEKASSGLSGAAAMDIGENPVLPAQLIPGRGAELASSGMLVLAPIKFKTGEPPGPKLTSAYGRERLMYTPQTALQAFAFKMQLAQPDYIRDEDETPPVTRFVVHNVFRHVLAGPNNTGYSELPYGTGSVLWNQTLGPDRSFVRKAGSVFYDVPGQGSAYSIPPATSGLVNTLSSPFRYPVNGDFMFTRMTRQLMENLGWNANPLKFMSVQPGSGDAVATSSLQVYGNAVASNDALIYSMPNRVPADATSPSQKGSSFGYRSQNSQGKISYNFNNDGTNPVCVEIVITRVKKGHQLTAVQLKESMVQAYETGYLNYSYANRNQANFSGAAPGPEDVTTNSRGPFLPAKALSNYKLTLLNDGQFQTNQSSHPWKQVARDQFIVSAGSTRNWSTSLQAMDYYANRYPQWQAPPPPEPAPGTFVPSAGLDNESNCVDDLSYIVSIAVSGVPAPYVEYNKGDAYPDATASLASVIDRRGTACSVSVTGAYKEVCHPVYLAQTHTDTYINGRLDIPMYDFPTTPAGVPQLTTNDIANIGQAVRTSDANSALIGMGPFNTVGGG